MDSWCDLLVRWVNSLNIIHSPLKSIQEIKDNDYFVQDLLAIINPESNYGSPPPKPAKEAWTNLVELLQSKYPNCDVARLCTEENEVYLFTLLMHYVCVLVKHPDLLKNILKNLPPEDHASVAHVLMYLQDGEKKITAEVLMVAITKSFKDPKEKLVHLKSSSATLSRQASPLGIQFSRTSPISRVSAQSPGQSIKVLSDKNREIKRLKSDLESEISENVRLQEEIKIEKDKNTDLAHKLDRQTTEIKRLREEYFATEDLPSSDKGDAKVVEKRYKAEVKSLEEYVASLHVDIEKLQVEKEEGAIKLATLEHYTSMWCEKAMKYEENCLKLEEELQQSTIELDGYRRHCSELEEIIQTLRPKPISIECDSPLRLNTTTSTSGSLSENMGEVFVDYLLHEKVEENARLMDDINLIKTEKQELECDLKKLKSEIDNLCTQRQSLEEANKVLLLKNQKHCINIFILNEKIQCLRENMVKINMLKEMTETDLKKTKCQLENWTSRTASMGKRIEEMQKEIYNLTQKLEYAQIKLNEESTSKAELQQSHISCTEQFEHNLGSLKQVINVLEQTLSNTDADKVVLQKQNKELEEENAKLRETITQANEESSKLNCSVKELKSTHCVQIAELEKKQSLIAQLEITNTKLEASINSLKNESQESFSLMKHEMEDRINTLEEEKESIRKELEVATQIEEQLLEKDVVIENLKTKSINLDLIIEKLKLENSSHCNSLVSLNASLLEERTKKEALLQENAFVKDSNTKLLNRINTLEEENEKHCFNIGALEKHIKDEKESKDQIIYKLDGDIKLAYDKNSEMQAEISRFALQIKVLKEEETFLKEKVSELESKNKNLAQLFEECYKIWNVERQITEKLNIISVSWDLKEELDNFLSRYNSIKLKCNNILSQKSTSIAETKKIHTFLAELADILTRLEDNTIVPTIMFEIKLTNASWALEKLGNTMEVRAESTDHSSYLQDEITNHTITMKEKIEIVQLKISNLKSEMVIGEEKCKVLDSLLANIAKTTSDRHALSNNTEIEDNGLDPDDSLEMAVASKSKSIDSIENQDRLGEGNNTVSIQNFNRLKELNSNYEKKLNEMKDIVSDYFEQKEAALKNLDDLKKIAVPLAAYDKCLAENRDLRIKVIELKNKLISVEKQSTDSQTMKKFIEERVRHEFEEKLNRSKQEMIKLMNEELKKKKHLAIMEKT